jgi:hypothetical protein
MADPRVRKVLGFPDARRRRDPSEAQTLIRAALKKTGAVAFSGHARNAMEDEEITAVEVEGALRAGTVREPEAEKGEWRYQVHTQRLTVVVAFRSNKEIVVVTVWRN